MSEALPRSDPEHDDRRSDRRDDRDSKRRSRSPDRRDRDSRRSGDRDSYRDDRRSYRRSRSPDRRRGSDRDGYRDDRRRGGRSRSRERREKTERAENDIKYSVNEHERGLRTVFVRNLPVKAAEKDIMEWFDKMGCKVRDVQLIADRNSRKSKGFGYVEFYQKESIDIAVSNNNADFWGKNVTIQFSQAEKNKQTNVTTAAVTGPCRVLVNNLHYAISEDMVREIFQVYGEVSSVSLEVEETGISKGEGVVSFKSAEDARTAVAEANNVEIAGKPIRVAFASELRPDSGIGLTAADLDDEDNAFKLNTQTRHMLMQRLAHARDTDLTAASQAFTPAAPQQLVGVQTPSPYLLLKNMFDPSTETEPNFDADIAEDVKEEAGSHGRVLHIYVDKFSQGLVYLKFDSVDAATKCGQTLHGRWFAGRMITAEFVQPDVYASRFPGL